jgi:hypothetical protein
MTTTITATIIKLNAFSYSGLQLICQSLINSRRVINSITLSKMSVKFSAALNQA